MAARAGAVALALISSLLLPAGAAQAEDRQQGGDRLRLYTNEADLGDT